MTSAGPSKDDPWSDQVSDAQGTTELPVSAGIQLQMIDVATEDNRGKSVDDDSDSVSLPIRVENVADTPSVYTDREENQIIDDDGISYWQAGSEPETDLDLSLDGLGEEAVLPDEPEPLAEYDGDLVEALYDANEDTEIRPIDLRLDELVSDIDYATAAERDQIYGLLSEFSSKRLSNWLTWLHDQEWTGKSLVLFLEFRDLWAATPQWWEYSVWSDWLNRWWTYSSPNVMSRDAAYEVIQQRLEYQADEIIEEAWFRDWDDLALWERGFHSFASYVVFRVGLNADEDWTSYLGWAAEGHSRPSVPRHYFHGNDSGDIFALWADRLQVWEDYTPFRTYVGGPPLWFAVQDWYDTAEWHDHLGWAINWKNTVHPYLSPESLDTWMDYKKDKNA
ncbi:MAG: hypothetical protein J4G14_07905 [Dehalococcoidia bacterium]|nr:hypothetical protein [Dehalococcoidia bacterium]